MYVVSSLCITKKLIFLEFFFSLWIRQLLYLTLYLWNTSMLNRNILFSVNFECSEFKVMHTTVSEAYLIFLVEEVPVRTKVRRQQRWARRWEQGWERRPQRPGGEQRDDGDSFSSAPFCCAESPRDTDFVEFIFISSNIQNKLKGKCSPCHLCFLPPALQDFVN